MFSIFKQVHRHTGVEASLVCHFYNDGEENLLVSSVNYLDVYRIIENEQNNLVFDLCQTFRFSGNICSMESVRFSGINDRDCIVLAFPDAKISVVRYDEDTHDLKTLALNYFEDTDRASGVIRNAFIPQIRVDPNNRCVSGLFYGHLIAVVTLRCEFSKLRRTSLLDESVDIGRAFSVSFGAQAHSVAIDSRLASYTIDITKLPNAPMIHVHDIQFLHGYFEPTLLILGETQRNWVGRLGCKIDSCVVAAVSLTADLEDVAANNPNPGQSLQPPVIWYVESLPFDAFRLLPIPRPIGGALLFCNNSLLYLNQSVPLFGIAVNSIGERTTNLAAVKISENQPDLAITLDCCQATFIGPKDDRTILISLANGDLYVLTLFADSMRFMRSFRFDKAASSVFSTCISVMKPNAVFLGSRLGNSLLLRYQTTEPADSKIKDVLKPFQPEQKRRKVDDLIINSSAEEDLDALLFEDTESAADETSMEAIIYQFQVCASLTTTGPCSQAVAAHATGLSEEFCGQKQEPELELITTAGHGRNGAICMMQRHIRPQIVTGFSLPGCVDMWTVACSYRPDGAEGNPDMHSFLIISRSDSTLVLETGQEIAEVDDTRGFSTIFSTVLASSIGQSRYIVQVTSTAALLLDGQRELHTVNFGDKTIVQAACSDPYVSLLTSDGMVMLVEFTEDSKLTLKRLDDLAADVTSVSCFEDKSGLASLLACEPIKSDNCIVPTGIQLSGGVFDNLPENADDEDVLLYGESLHQLPKNPIEPKVEVIIEKPPLVIRKYLAIVRSNGCLELYSLPDLQLAFRCQQFADGPQVLAHNGLSGLDMEALNADDFPLPTISEICFVNIDTCRKHLYLLASTTNNRIYIYEAYSFGSNQGNSRFARVPNETLLVDLQKVRRTSVWQPTPGQHQSLTQVASRVDDQETPQIVNKLLLVKRASIFRPYEDIAGYSGVFICGPRPHWLMANKMRPNFRCHPMAVEGNVPCLSEFHNPNCERGFVYYNSEDELRIAVLPTHVDYTDVWPTRRVPLKATAHLISYIPSQQLFAVIYSESTEKLTKLVHWETEERQLIPLERDNRFIWPQAKKHTLQLYTSASWESVPAGKFEFEDWEQVTCMRVARLKGETQATSTHEVLSIGTNFSYGEDVLSRGRILIFDVADVVPEPGQPLTRYRLKKVCTREEKGPVTSMCVVGGSLLISIGQRVYVFVLRESADIQPVSFIDSRLFNVASAGLKNFALLGDIQKSVTLLRYQEDHKILSLIARDFRSMPVMSVDFLVDNTQLGFISTDIDGNLIVFTHQPESRESYGAQRLIPRSDINLGSRINSVVRVRCRLGPLRKDARFLQQYDHRHVNYLPSLDGGIGMLLPIKEQLYRRLLMLQKLIVANLPHHAGLNPSAYRLYRSNYRPLYNQLRSVIDGDLVYRYAWLPFRKQAELARRMGTTVDQLHADLAEVQAVTAHF